MRKPPSVSLKLETRGKLVDMINLRALLGTFCLLVAMSNLFAQVHPAREFGELFDEVQRQKIFKDQKKFPDCPAKFSPEDILKRYQQESDGEGFDLKTFVAAHFDTLLVDTADLLHHIDYLWTYLTKQPKVQSLNSSLISLPCPYIVPGGRFREIYYWDSYFTMLGLQVAGRDDLIENMVMNFAWLIDRYGHIPNGNRTYYLSRSQPPFFSLMVELLEEIKGDTIYATYLPRLEKEYRFWMEGRAEFLPDDTLGAIKRVVRLGRDRFLNRYWDALTAPRPESYLHDVELKESSRRDSSIYREIRAAAESGWDFSSRWCREPLKLTTIRTTEIVSVDLNCLLYHLERSIAKAYRICGQTGKEGEYELLAHQRKQLILDLCWNEREKYFFDFDYRNVATTDRFTLAGLFPMFFGMENDSARIASVLELIEGEFLKPGGLVTTTRETGEQWDAPNGWAPLQWVGYSACLNYSDRFPKARVLAEAIATRWVCLNCKVFFETGKMLEKYNVIDVDLPGGGGEYQLQDGFGWTNGVFLKFWQTLEESRGAATLEEVGQ